MTCDLTLETLITFLTNENNNIDNYILTLEKKSDGYSISNSCDVSSKKDEMYPISRQSRFIVVIGSQVANVANVGGESVFYIANDTFPLTTPPIQMGK